MAVKKKECKKCGYQNKLNAKKCFNCDADLTLGGKLAKAMMIGFGIILLIGFLSSNK